MYEAYAATLVGVVCGALAVAALDLTRRLPPMAYALAHVTVIVVMIVLVTMGYQKVPLLSRHPHAGMSSFIYIAVSWVMFVNTLLCHWYLHRPKSSPPTLSSNGPIA